MLDVIPYVFVSRGLDITVANGKQTLVIDMVRIDSPAVYPLDLNLFITGRVPLGSISPIITTFPGLPARLNFQPKSSNRIHNNYDGSWDSTTEGAWFHLGDCTEISIHPATSYSIYDDKVKTSSILGTMYIQNLNQALLKHVLEGTCPTDKEEHLLLMRDAIRLPQHELDRLNGIEHYVPVPDMFAERLD